MFSEYVWSGHFNCYKAVPSDIVFPQRECVLKNQMAMCVFLVHIGMRKYKNEPKEGLDVLPTDCTGEINWMIPK